MRNLALVLGGSALIALLFTPRLAATQPVPARTTTLAPITLSAPFQTFTDVNKQMIGAGPNTVAILGEDGKVTKTFSTSVSVPTITPHGANGILIGDTSLKVVTALDLTTGAQTQLLKLSDVKDPMTKAVPSKSLLARGKLMSVGSDGTNVFVGISAGFSSAIFKVDPVSKQILDRAWASASDPQAMVFQNGALFVLTDGGTSIRRFTDRLERSKDSIELGSPARGLGMRTGELRLMNAASAQVQRVPVDNAELQPAAVKKNLASTRASSNPGSIATLQPKQFKPVAANVRYALLITGDLAENFSGECFWNDTVWMYKTLLANGYDADDIIVLYGDGQDYVSANPYYKHSSKVTNLAATVANVNLVLDGFKNGAPMFGIPKIDANDSLFIWTFDHGSKDDMGESTLCLRDGQIAASAMATKLNAFEYQRRALFAQQCFSGGFIDALKNNKTFISTAAKSDELAWPADTEKEVYGGKTYTHGEFDFHVISALNRQTPGSTVVNADSNNDSWVSVLELSAWEQSHESKQETPQMSDVGSIGGVFKFAKMRSR